MVFGVLRGNRGLGVARLGRLQLSHLLFDDREDVHQALVSAYLSHELIPRITATMPQRAQLGTRDASRRWKQEPDSLLRHGGVPNERRPLAALLAWLATDLGDSRWAVAGLAVLFVSAILHSLWTSGVWRRFGRTARPLVPTRH